MSRKTSITAILVHAAIFALILSLLKSATEGFQTGLNPIYNETGAQTLIAGAEAYLAEISSSDRDFTAASDYIAGLIEKKKMVDSLGMPMMQAGAWAGALENLTPPAQLKAAYSAALAATYGFPAPSKAAGAACDKDRSETEAPTPSMCKYSCLSGYGTVATGNGSLVCA
jgi:hypothetical protein